MRTALYILAAYISTSSCSFFDSCQKHDLDAIKAHLQAPTPIDNIDLRDCLAPHWQSHPAIARAVISSRKFVEGCTGTCVRLAFRKVSTDPDYVTMVKAQSDALVAVLKNGDSGPLRELLEDPANFTEQYKDGQVNFLPAVLRNSRNGVLEDISQADPLLAEQLRARLEVPVLASEPVASEPTLSEPIASEPIVSPNVSPSASPTVTSPASVDRRGFYKELQAAAGTEDMAEALVQMLHLHRRLIPGNQQDDLEWEQAFNLVRQKMEDEEGIMLDPYQVRSKVKDYCFTHSLESDWEEVRKLGNGAYGVVNLYRRRADGALMAGKTVEWSENGKVEPIVVLKELVISLLLRHPNLIRLEDVYLGAGQDELLFALEYVSAGDLKGLLKQGFQYNQDKRPIAHTALHLTEAHILPILHQLLTGLAHMHHHRIIHRDLKPANVLLNRDGVMKIADFGLSTWVDVSVGRRSLYGTPSFMAPAVLSGGYGTSVDLWSVAMLLFNLVEGEVPYAGLSAAEMGLEVEAGTPPTKHHPEWWTPRLTEFYEMCIQLSSSNTGSAAELLALPYIREAVDLTALRRLINPGEEGEEACLLSQYDPEDGLAVAAFHERKTRESLRASMKKAGQDTEEQQQVKKPVAASKVLFGKRNRANINATHK